MDFTADEIEAIRTALFAYQMETEGYLSGYQRDVPHAACCETFQALQVRRADERASLFARLCTINAALGRLPKDIT